MLFPPASRRLAGKSGFARAEPLRPLGGLSMRKFIGNAIASAPPETVVLFVLANLGFFAVAIYATFF